MTEHLASMGAIEIPQSLYLKRLRAAQRSTEGVGAALGAGAGVALGDAAGVGAGLALPDGFAALLADAAGAGLSSSPGNFIAQLLTQTS